MIDGITSQTSLTRFTLAQIASILSLVDLLKGKSIHDAGRGAEVVFDRFSDSTDKERVHSVWITGKSNCGRSVDCI